MSISTNACRSKELTLKAFTREILNAPFRQSVRFNRPIEDFSDEN